MMLSRLIGVAPLRQWKTYVCVCLVCQCGGQAVAFPAACQTPDARRVASDLGAFPSRFSLFSLGATRLASNYFITDCYEVSAFRCITIKLWVISLCCLPASSLQAPDALLDHIARIHVRRFFAYMWYDGLRRRHNVCMIVSARLWAYISGVWCRWVSFSTISCVGRITSRYGWSGCSVEGSGVLLACDWQEMLNRKCLARSHAPVTLSSKRSNQEKYSSRTLRQVTRSGYASLRAQSRKIPFKNAAAVVAGSFVEHGGMVGRGTVSKPYRAKYVDVSLCVL